MSQQYYLDSFYNGVQSFRNQNTLEDRTRCINNTMWANHHYGAPTAYVPPQPSVVYVATPVVYVASPSVYPSGTVIIRHGMGSGW